MKLLAVCGFGVGSSLVLRMSLQKVAQTLGIDADIENTDLTNARGIACDAIFTSFELQQELADGVQCPVYAVKKYMDLEEIEEVFKIFLAR